MTQAAIGTWIKACVLACALAASAACASDKHEAEPSSSAGTAGSAGRAGSWAGSPDPGPPPADVCHSERCMPELTLELREALGPREGLPSIVHAECQVASQSLSEAGSISIWGLGCVCDTDQGARHVVLDTPGWCAVRGHAHDCLMWHGEIEACDPQDAHSCDAVCADVGARIAQDAMTAKDFDIVSTSCEHEAFEWYSTGDCFGVVRIDRFCYPLSPTINWLSAQSCELSEYELRQAPIPPMPDCDARADTAPTAECRVACDSSDDCSHGDRCWFGADGDEDGGVDTRGLCAQCFSDADCDEAEKCTRYGCIPSDNVECLSNTDCATNGLCVLESGAVRATSCLLR